MQLDNNPLRMNPLITGGHIQQIPMNHPEFRQLNGAFGMRPLNRNINLNNIEGRNYYLGFLNQIIVPPIQKLGGFVNGIGRKLKY